MLRVRLYRHNREHELRVDLETVGGPYTRLSAGFQAKLRVVAADRAICAMA